MSGAIPNTQKEIGKMAKLADFYNDSPYSADYIDIESILGKTVTLIHTQGFENAKGKGVHALISIDGEERRICTHGISLTDTLTKAEIQDALEKGDYFVVKFVKVKSKTSGNPVLKVIDAEEDA